MLALFLHQLSIVQVTSLFGRRDAEFVGNIRFAATPAAAAATLFFSSSERTGPRKVTLLFTVTILTLCAYVERLLSLTMELRICLVTSSLKNSSSVCRQ